MDSFIDLKFLLGLINSKLLSYYFQYLNPEIGEVLVEIKKENVEKLLIKETANQQPFITLVDRILAAKQANTKADTSALKKEIDRLVYELYGLTEEEIKIVEGR